MQTTTRLLVVVVSHMQTIPKSATSNLRPEQAERAGNDTLQLLIDLSAAHICFSVSAALKSSFELAPADAAP